MRIDASMPNDTRRPAPEVDEQRLASDLRGATERGEMYLVFQPIVRLDDAPATPTGVEALLRWQHPEYGLVSPARFIPLAEEAGISPALGRWVLREACEAIVSLPPACAAITVSVNVSGRQLEDDAVAGDVDDALAASRLAPERLTLEVTETALVTDPRRARRVLGELRTFGLRIAIDDFGTGYSSLRYLQQLPMDVLKIDRSFVADVTRPAGPSLAFPRTIVALAQALGLRTVAEGIELPVQRDALAELGCTHGQGYLFARPLPLGDLVRWLEAPPVPADEG